ncbi:MAG TPA: hypothetical protein VJV78_26460 [Polyangiales bacterium]|nr:hypothetical protein [Polyangiales bacterium]
MRLFKLLGCLAIVLGATSASALASDTKFYPGFACVPQTPGGTEIDGAGGVLNTRSSSSALFCPAIDDTLSTNVSAVVWVTDQSSTQDIVCGLRSRNADGGSVGFTTAGTTGTNDVERALVLPSVPRGIYQFIACSIPAVDQGRKSGITTYSVSR